MLSKEVVELKNYIEKYRSELPQDTFDSNEYSIKLIQIPKISNTNRNDLAIEFVNWNSINEEEQDNYEKVTTIIKDKVIKKNVYNLDFMKPSDVRKKLELHDIEITTTQHTMLWKSFKVRPSKNSDDKFDTIGIYCIYDEVHNDYVYTKEWVNFIISLFKTHNFTTDNINELTKVSLNIEDYK